MSAFRELIHLRAEEVRTARFKDAWRKANPNNSTVPQNRFPMSVAEVGDYTYGPIHLVYGGGGGHLKIGRFCSIGPNVTFVVGDEHPLDRLSTFPFDVMTLGAGEPEAIGRGGSSSETMSGSATGRRCSTESISAVAQSSPLERLSRMTCRPMRLRAAFRPASSGSASTRT